MRWIDDDLRSTMTTDCNQTIARPIMLFVKNDFTDNEFYFDMRAQ